MPVLSIPLPEGDPLRDLLVEEGVIGAGANDFEKKMIHVPGVGEVLHLIPKAKISEEEMKAHKKALRAKMPSPLSPRQLAGLKAKRDMYLRIMRSPTPMQQRNIGYALNQVENVGDMMTAAYWGLKGSVWLVRKAAPKLASRTVPWVGWALTGKDIADTINVFKLGRAATGEVKHARFGKASINPFSTVSKATRAIKAATKLPSIPDWIEIAQVTDQLFGVGISFGAIVGFGSDLFHGLLTGAKFEKGSLKSFQPDDL